MLNALTIDVEDYFHVGAFKKYIRPEDWDQYPVRVENNTLRILDMLDVYSVKATFFILGWVAERMPSIVKNIQKRGHEIACHGYGHQLIQTLGPHKFREDVARSRLLLEDICGVKIQGYRAPSFSITKKTMWALDILIENGFLYDSSIFPIIHDVYGIPDYHRFPHDIKCSSGYIREFPLSTINFKIVVRDFRFPVSGGGYLRLLPAWVIEKSISYINNSEDNPAVIYFHPWEIDADQPRIKSGLKSNIRHYLHIDKTVNKVKYLLPLFKFATMSEVLGL